MKDVESLARELMSNAGTIREEFTTAKHLEHVRPMFQVYPNIINSYIFVFSFDILESMVTMFSSI